MQGIIDSPWVGLCPVRESAESNNFWCRCWWNTIALALYELIAGISDSDRPGTRTVAPPERTSRSVQLITYAPELPGLWLSWSASS